MYNKLLKIASKMDSIGLHCESDKLETIIIRLAQFRPPIGGNIWQKGYQEFGSPEEANQFTDIQTNMGVQQAMPDTLQQMDNIKQRYGYLQMSVQQILPYLQQWNSQYENMYKTLQQEQYKDKDEYNRIIYNMTNLRNQLEQQYDNYKTMMDEMETLQYQYGTLYRISQMPPLQTSLPSTQINPQGY